MRATPRHYLLIMYPCWAAPGSCTNWFQHSIFSVLSMVPTLMTEMFLFKCAYCVRSPVPDYISGQVDNGSCNGGPGANHYQCIKVRLLCSS